MDEDLDHLKEKVDAGCDYLTTQMFFDNSIYYNFMYKALKKGIQVPVVAGIMPVTGVPLPFLSYGVSSLTTNLMLVALLLNIKVRKQNLQF